MMDAIRRQSGGNQEALRGQSASERLREVIARRQRSLEIVGGRGRSWVIMGARLTHIVRGHWRSWEVVGDRG